MVAMPMAEKDSIFVIHKAFLELHKTVAAPFGGKEANDTHSHSQRHEIQNQGSKRLSGPTEPTATFRLNLGVPRRGRPALLPLVPAGPTRPSRTRSRTRPALWRRDLTPCFLRRRRGQGRLPRCWGSIRETRFLGGGANYGMALVTEHVMKRGSDGGQL